MSIEKPQTIYKLEKKENQITLSEEQKRTVQNITLGIEEVDETVREMAQDDVIKTLENGHPLNRLINDQEGKLSGFIACEDFVPNEAYIKYFGTNGQVKRNIFQELPAFFEYAKSKGYAKLNFHGWNERLNHALEYFGFQRIRTDRMNGLSADFYEKVLTEQKTSETITEERKNAFEQKYIQKIKKEYEQTLKTFSEENRQKKEQKILEVYEKLSQRIPAGFENLNSNSEDKKFEFKEKQQVILKLKLARHFQNNENIDINTLFDAIIETPKFISTDKGSFFKLLEVHEQKTLEKIAEMRKQRAEMGNEAKSNPYENLFTTKSGKYYLARLLNMPHLQEESEYMNHCVGTSDSYVNKIKRGDIEILSFRQTPKINPKTQKLEGDTPIITIEYNLKTKEIEQMKKANDAYLNPNDPFYADVIDALKQLRTTQTDTGETRDFKKISSSELENIKVQDYHLLTENGEIHFKDFDPETNIFVLKIGKMEINEKTPKEDAVKIFHIIESVKLEPNQIATGLDQINENTKAYIGNLEKGIFEKIQKYNIEHVFTRFPEGKIQRYEIEIGGKSNRQLEQEMKAKNIWISNYAQDILKKMEILEQKEETKLIRLTVGDLGFPSGATIDQIYQKAQDLGLELCPAEVGPSLRLREPMINEYCIIRMKQITDRGGSPNVFRLGRNDDGFILSGGWAKPASKWNSHSRFVFCLRKLET